MLGAYAKEDSTAEWMVFLLNCTTPNIKLEGENTSFLEKSRVATWYKRTHWHTKRFWSSEYGIDSGA